jgi:hypothetical protein
MKTSSRTSKPSCKSSRTPSYALRLTLPPPCQRRIAPRRGLRGGGPGGVEFPARRGAGGRSSRRRRCRSPKENRGTCGTDH